MTPDENAALDALELASMRIASAGKRFRNDMLAQRRADPAYKLTERQALYLWSLVFLYRRQIPNRHLLGCAEYRQIHAELPPIYLEGDHRAPVMKEKPPGRKRPMACEPPAPPPHPSLFD